MFIRTDKLQVEMPLRNEPAPSAAAALNELRGGRFGEPTRLNISTFQGLG
ncbi:hypothetical protein SAMN02745194_04648 [Roseomonas rosea]|uniref:Uncharacterized protein n=1 Tax=Muricoccus roseus TaxID=198092 RepID=A0A1M6RDC2_9PROT|nr:hypothetical protein [Roseomonas rosea]SHK30348.1 hypothetical protein SAMN02745194_04648 [Roseomonas rosea]